MILWTLGRKGDTVKVVKFPIQLGDIWMKLKDRKKLLTIMEIQEVSRRELAMVAGWKSHRLFYVCQAAIVTSSATAETWKILKTRRAR